MPKVKLSKHKGHLVPKEVTFLVDDLERSPAVENVSYDGYFTKGHPEKEQTDFRGYDEVHRNLILRINHRDYTVIISIRTPRENIKGIVDFVKDYKF